MNGKLAFCMCVYVCACVCVCVCVCVRVCVCVCFLPVWSAGCPAWAVCVLSCIFDTLFPVAGNFPSKFIPAETSEYSGTPDVKPLHWNCLGEKPQDHPDERSPWWDISLMRDHPKELPHWWTTTDETMMMKNKYHSGERPQRWRITMMKGQYDETTMMRFDKDHPLEKPSPRSHPGWWETTLMESSCIVRDHPDDKWLVKPPR